MDTSQNFLHRAKTDSPDVWDRFVVLYTPLITKWLQRFGVDESDRQDITQEVLLAASREIQGFEHNGRRGAFRNWLRTISYNRCKRHWRIKSRQVSVTPDASIVADLDQFCDPNSELTKQWDREHDEYVLRGMLEIMTLEFGNEAMEVFKDVVFEGISFQTAANKHGWTIGKVYKSKFRIMQRLREEARQYLG